MSNRNTALSFAALALLACAAESPPPAAETAAAPPAATAAQPPRTGEIAPDFALTDQDGQTVRLADLRGEPAVLVFYRGHW